MTEEEGTCCPKGSWPSLQLEKEYTPTGHMEEFNGLPMYVNGDPSSGKAIIVIPDVFGPTAGRTKAIVDHFALEGYYSIVPDIFRGNNMVDFNAFVEWGKKFPYHDYVQHQLRDCCVPFLTGKGINSIGLIGFCWGSWAIFEFCSDETVDHSLVKCGVNCHPSLMVEQYVFGRDPMDIVKRVRVPQLLLSAGNDPEMVQPGGSVEQELSKKDFGKNCHVHHFDSQHGYVNRGDITVESVRNDVERSLQLALDYFHRLL